LRLTHYILLTICAFTTTLVKAQTATNTVGDSTRIVVKDTLINKVVENNSGLDHKVTYSAKDSMVFDIVNQKIYLYGASEVVYEQLNLKADKITLDIKNNLVHAKGTLDSTGKTIGKPKFEEGTNKFDADSMLYNFETRKGRISNVLTQEGDGYIHGAIVKKTPKEEYYIANGKYTTCNHETNPHFYIKAKKLKVIPEDKIITGPADLYILDIPTPLAVPFGFFPNKKGRKSGIILPKPGNSQNLGFSLKEGGYYWGINDKIDFALLGDIYSRGSYRLSAASQYAKRYKYNGSIRLDYSLNKFGLKGDYKNYNETKNYGVHWHHQQDAKAHPTRTFNAEVNAVSNKFNAYNRTNVDDIQQSSFNSNINYTKRFANTPFSFSAYASQSQSTQSKLVSLVLPGASLNMNQINPLRRKNATGAPKWYENIGLSYTANTRNEVQFKDTAFKYLARIDTLSRKLSTGLQHTASLSTNFKVLKYFNVQPSVNYTENWHIKQVNKTITSIKNKANTKDSTYVIKQDTSKGFYQSRAINLALSASSTVYGMYQFKGAKLQALRHVIRPSLSFNYIPVLKKNPFYELQAQGTLPKQTIYYDPYLGAYASANNSTINQGNVRLSLANNFEAKIKSKKDSTNGGTHKVQVLDYLGFDAGYNIFADSLNLSTINVSARNVFFKLLNITSNARFDPYSYNDTTGIAVNKFQYNKSKQLARLTSADLGIQFSLNSKTNTPVKPNVKNDAELQMIQRNPYAYVDFSIPWNVSVSYNLTYNETKKLLTRTAITTPVKTNSIVQALQLRGDLNITPKWKVGVTTGYDIKNKEFTTTNLDLYRDLHCWELHFNLVPFGPQLGYFLNINVKSGTLQDLKLSRRRSWYDLQ
jgi:lipopolysaccharide assembly outer membrane protein LptD (OstA)